MDGLLPTRFLGSRTACRVRGRRILLIAQTALGACGLVASVALASPAWADTVVTYEVTARADGLRFQVDLLNYTLVDHPVDMGVSSAQAQTDSTNGSTGFAGNPDPGDLVLAAPDLVAGVLQENSGQNVDVPKYPLYASSQYPITDKSEVEQPGYSLTARSSQSSSEAHASTGLGPQPGSVGRVTSSAMSAVDVATGAGSATAESDVQAFTINDVLQIGRVHSRAAVTSKPDGSVTRSSELSILDTRVAGQRVAITPKGVEAVGQTTGLPSSDQLNDVLKQAGVSVRYLAEKKLPHGVLSGGLEVTAERKDPTEGSNATVIVRYVFGQAWASASGTAEKLPDGSAALGGPVGGASQSSSQAASGSAPQARPASLDAPSADAPPGDARPVDAPASGAGPAGEKIAAQLMVRPGDIGGLGIYATLVFVALAVFGGGALVRLLGVRTRWTS